MKSSDKFYETLPSFTKFNQFNDSQFYKEIPSDWLVLITDVVGSTKAIDQGLYKQVNAVGVASIVALTNSLKPLKIPYTFGGDGTTACFPASEVDKVKPALVACKEMAKKQFNLELRIGLIPVAILYDLNLKLKISKFQPHQFYQQAMFSGNGLSYAESLVKNDLDDSYLIKQDTFCGDDIFKGFECRWQEIPSPHQETICLLVQATDKSMSDIEQTYADIIHKVEMIYGQNSQHHPLKEENLKLTGLNHLLSVESGIRCAFKSRFKKWGYQLKLKFLTMIGNAFMNNQFQSNETNWGVYKKNLIINTDYRKFDELLRMVISGSKLQRQQLRTFLENYKSRNKIVFGIHSSESSLLTCIVTDYNKDHVHFLDGANGGYAMAAKELKSQLKES